METSPEVVTKAVPVAKKKAGRPKKKAKKSSVIAKPSVAEGTSSKKALLVGEEGRIEVLGKGQKWFEVIVNEKVDEGRTSVFTTDGVSQTFLVKYDVPQIIPQGAINCLRESIYTKFFQNLKGNTPQMTALTLKNISRFTVEILREMSEEEARKTLRAQKKLH